MIKLLIPFLLLPSLVFALTCPCGSSNVIKMSIFDNAPYPPQGSTYYVCANCGGRYVNGYWMTALDYLKEYGKAKKEKIKRMKEKD